MRVDAVLQRIRTDSTVFESRTQKCQNYGLNVEDTDQNGDGDDAGSKHTN